MPDLDPLPTPRRPALPPREGDWDDMTRRVGRRRRARLAAAGGMAAATVAIAVLVSVTSPDLDRLVADPVTSGSASPTAAETVPPPTPESPSPVAPPTSPAPGATSEPVAEPSATAAPSPTAEPTSEPSGPPHATMRRTEVAFEATRGCTPGSGEGPGWCVRVPPNATAQAGDPRDYVLDYCRLTGSGAATITFHSVYEIWFHVARGSDPVYVYGDETWSPATHSTVVRAGRCARWTLTWDATDEDGLPLRPGDYDVSVGLRAGFSSSPGASSTVYGFSLRISE